MPLAGAAAGPTATLITGLAGAAATGISAATAPSAQVSGVIALPPELEAEQLRLIEQAIGDADKERKRSLAIADTLESRANIEAQVARGLLPREQALKEITRQNETIARTFGEEILNQVRTLSPALTREAEQLINQPLQEFKDPQVERELEQGKAALEERLVKELGPGYATSEAGIRALRAFDQGATELRSSTSRNVRNERTGRLSAVADVALRQGQSLFAGRESATGALAGGIYAGDQASKNLLEAQDARLKAADLGRLPFGLLQQFGAQRLSSDVKYGLQRFRGDAGTFGGRGFIDPNAPKPALSTDPFANRKPFGGTYSG